MKKTLLMAAAASQIMTQAYAGGDIEPVEHHASAVHEHAESDYYVIVKALRVTGDTVDHEGAILDGDSDYGFGIDLGYRLGNGFAVEYDFAYAKNTVSEDGLPGVNGKYYTHALDLVYTHELTETVGIFGKVGVEYENEKIKELDIDSDETGLNFGAGVEMAINHRYKFVVEYEHSTIDGPRGDSIFAGVMYNF
jgi:opacity protein-like surface antigen